MNEVEGMKEFEEALKKLVEASSDAKDEDKLENDQKVVEYIKGRILISPGSLEIISIIERVYKRRKMHVPARALAEALKEMPDEPRVRLLDSFCSKPEKAIVYHLIAQMLTQNQIVHALSRLDFCCNLITDNCNRTPTKDLIRTLHYALFMTPGLKEKPMRALVDEKVPECVAICLIHLTFDPELRKQRKGGNIIIEEKVLSATSSSWFRLSSEKQRIQSKALKSIFNDARNKQFARRAIDELNLPGELIAVLGISEPVIAKIDAKPESFVPMENKENVDALNTPQHPKIGEHIGIGLTMETEINPQKTLENLENWITNAQKYKKRVTQEISELNKKNEILSTENANLKKMYDQSTSAHEELLKKFEIASEIKDQLEIKIKSEIENAQASKRQFAVEAEQQKERELLEAKNRIAADLRFVAEDIFKLKQDEDTADKSRRLGKYLENIFSILERHGIRFEL